MFLGDIYIYIHIYVYIHYSYIIHGVYKPTNITLLRLTWMSEVVRHLDVQLICDVFFSPGLSRFQYGWLISISFNFNHIFIKHIAWTTII